MINKLPWPLLAATVILIAAAPVSAQLANPAGQTALSGNHPLLAERLSPMAEAEPEMPMTMRITLALHHRADLDQLLRDQQDPSSPRYHQWLTPQEFNARFGPSQAQADAVSNWLARQGFLVTAASL